MFKQQDTAVFLSLITTKKTLIIIQFFFFLMVAQNCFSLEWTSSNIQLLYGSDFEFGDTDRTTVTVEHANGWQYGQNFFFIDVTDRSDIGFEVYAEIYSYLSYNKVTDSKLSLGAVKDISLVARTKF